MVPSIGIITIRNQAIRDVILIIHCRTNQVIATHAGNTMSESKYSSDFASAISSGKAQITKALNKANIDKRSTLGQGSVKRDDVSSVLSVERLRRTLVATSYDLTKLVCSLPSLSGNAIFVATQKTFVKMLIPEDGDTDMKTEEKALNAEELMETVELVIVKDLGAHFKRLQNVDSAYKEAKALNKAKAMRDKGAEAKLREDYAKERAGIMSNIIERMDGDKRLTHLKGIRLLDNYNTKMSADHRKSACELIVRLYEIGAVHRAVRSLPSQFIDMTMLMVSDAAKHGTAVGDLAKHAISRAPKIVDAKVAEEAADKLGDDAPIILDEFQTNFSSVSKLVKEVCGSSSSSGLPTKPSKKKGFKSARKARAAKSKA